MARLKNDAGPAPLKKMPSGKDLLRVTNSARDFARCATFRFVTNKTGALKTR
ncbi:hypothetical protein D3C72_2181780 [compost metagenome]